MATNPRSLVWFVRFRDLCGTLKAAGIRRAERAAALEAAYSLLDNARAFRSEALSGSAHGSLRLVLADDAAAPDAPAAPDYFEVRSDDAATAGHFQVELTPGAPEWDFYPTLDEAREAARVAREDHPATPIWIVGVTEERVEDVPAA